MRHELGAAGDPGMFQQFPGEHDAPFVVERELHAAPEGRRREHAMAWREGVEIVDPGAQALEPVDPTRLDRTNLVEGGVGDDAVEALAGEGGSETGGNRYPPLFVDLVLVSADE